MKSWIKVRTTLIDDGRILILSRSCNASRVTVLGALVTLWALADMHADAEGMLYGWTAEDINARCELPNFAQNMPSDWLDLSGEWVKLPKYQEHNGTTAKTRAQGTSRQQRYRRNAPIVTRALPEEKRRDKNRSEENINKINLINIGSHFRAAPTEIEKLKTEDGEEFFNFLVQTINDYCAANGRTYKDYPAAYRNFRKREKYFPGALKNKQPQLSKNEEKINRLMELNRKIMGEQHD